MPENENHENSLKTHRPGTLELEAWSLRGPGALGGSAAMPGLPGRPERRGPVKSLGTRGSFE